MKKSKDDWNKKQRLSNNLIVIMIKNTLYVLIFFINLEVAHTSYPNKGQFPVLCEYNTTLGKKQRWIK